MENFWDGFLKRAEAESYLLKHIKDQKLENHLGILEHPKVKSNPEQRGDHLAEIIRRYGNPYKVINSNPGGGYRSGPFDPVYKNSYWKSIGGKVDKNKKYMTGRQHDQIRYGS